MRRGSTLAAGALVGLGGAGITVGAAMLSTAAGWIVGGVLAVAAGLLLVQVR